MSEPDELSEAQTVAAGARLRSGESARVGGEFAGQIIDQYKLLEELGEGGMGTVWMAQQSEPVLRRVALKIIKLGMDTKEVVARFEIERQALALMDHAHIAKVLDAGSTERGRPYFVMELVRGTSITKFCDGAKLGLRERLELFSQVCHAIQHAHQKGIIHRDVKPSNVLVSLQDGVPVPKVIDFGIAKATHAELTQATLFTKSSQVIGTPEYMAPEQAELSALDIDTRVDVYSLGVLLYELLTGSKTFDLRQVQKQGQAEVLRMICEVDPAKPSTRISSMGESASEVAANRHLDIELLNRRLRGDLDWIVMKALEKDRTRRYATASGFAADIERYLNHEEVEAAPPSTRYRLGKLLQRRRKTVIALGSILLALLLGSLGTGIGWWKTSRANRSLDVALGEKAALLTQEAEQRLLAEASVQRAGLAKLDAEREAERASLAEREMRARAEELAQVADFQAEQLSGLNVERMGQRLQRALLEATPEAEREAFERELAGVNFTSLALRTLRENLFEQTVAAIDVLFAKQPVVQAQLLQTTASTLSKLGLADLALDPQQRALQLRREALGSAHPASLASTNHCGLLLNALGRTQEAEELILEALAGRRRVLGAEHPDTLVSISNMASLLFAQGRFDEAEPHYLEVLELQRRVMGAEHASTLISINNVGYVLQAQSRLLEAESYFREALQLQRRLQGDQHQATLTTINNLGYVLRAQGKLAAAEPLCREVADGRRRVLGDDHPETLAALGNLGALLNAKGELALAEPYYRATLEGFRRILGDEHPDTLTALASMGVLLYAQGKWSESELYLRESLDSRRRLLGDDHPSTLNSIHNLGGLLRAMGRRQEAGRYFGEALLGRRRVLGATSPSAVSTAGDYRGMLQDALREARAGVAELQLGQVLGELGALQLTLGQFDAAESTLAEALELLFAAAPEGDVSPWLAQANLGAACAGLGRQADGEPLLLEAAQALMLQDRSDSKADPKWEATRRVVLQVVELYAGWHAIQPGLGWDDKLAEWRDKAAIWLRD